MSEVISRTLALEIDEPDHPGCPLEWWFFHGHYSGAEVAERQFMISVFRHELRDAAAGRSRAFSALITVLDPATGENRVRSLIDGRLWDEVCGVKARTHWNINATLQEIYCDELRRHGVPREIERPDEAPVMATGPLRLHWADLELEIVGGRIELGFREPGTGRPVQVRMTAETPRLEIEAARRIGSPAEAMHYVSWPRLRLRGTAGGREIAGEGWFDHQWGGYAWQQRRGETNEVRGWDWLGWRLEDGSTWIAVLHWDCRTHEVFARHLTVRDAAGRVRVSEDLELTALRWWLSPRSQINYPVELRLRAPELEAELTFSATAADQEIPLLYFMRGIWEGAGRVRGSVGGRPAEGPARYEGHGYGFIFDLNEYFHGWAVWVDRHLEAFVPRQMEEKDLLRMAGPTKWAYEPAAYTQMLSAPLWDLVERDGKRWRAVFAVLMLQTLGGEAAQYQQLITVLPEMVHSASLIIDDIEDASSLRRGQETIHLRYGLDTAINAANTAYFLPMLLIFEHPHLTALQKQMMSETVVRQFIRAHLGQTLDLYWSRRITEERLESWMSDSLSAKILQMYALKTAAIVETLAKVACIIARRDEATEAAAIEFARAFGVAFQLVDDLHNFSPSRDWGKARGEDLREGKPTYLIMRALERLGPGERARLRLILCTPELRSDPAVLAEGIELVTGSGALEAVRQEAREMVAPAWEAFSLRVGPSLAKVDLRLVWEGLIELTLKPDSDMGIA